ncbi:MAG: hypothetical protein WC455_16260 [Dehalococcoidia bacterium]
MARNFNQWQRKVINNGGAVLHIPVLSDQSKIPAMDSFDPYAESVNAAFPVGSIVYEGEDVYAYCKNGSVALNIAAPIQGAARAHAEQDDDIVVAAIAAIGATAVSLTSTANLDTAPNDEDNDFAGGWLYVNDEAGQGQMYRIKSNGGFSGTANSTFTLYDPLTIALSVASQVGLVRNKYYRTLVTPAPLTAPFAGFPLIAVTASYYFWSKIKGPVPAIANAAITLGQVCAVGITAAKVNPMAVSSTYGITADTRPIGTAWTPGVADTEEFILDLW